MRRAGGLARQLALPKDYGERVRWMEANDGRALFPSARPRSRTTCGRVADGHEALVASGQPVVVNGRVMSIRRSGPGLWFLDVVQGQARLQLILNASQTGPARFSQLRAQLQRGDIIEAQGTAVKTASGQPSLQVNDLAVLAPCFRNFPDEKTPMGDADLRSRHRHHDLLSSPAAVQRLLLRSHVVQHVRSFLLARHFVEVETPILSSVAGGALARPFETVLDEEDGRRLQLRIAPELFLKRLVVGGLDRVFEIGRVFRNEALDATHQPEFTTCEFYQAYGVLDETMDAVEELVGELAAGVGTRFQRELRVERPFARIDVVEELQRRLGPVPWDDEEALGALLVSRLRSAGLPGHGTLAQQLDRLIGHWLEPACQQPTFLHRHPLVLSPLAKGHGHTAHRFELFVGGRELANGYEELNDPFEQSRRFSAQVRLQGKEGPPPDEQYVEALMTGLPPTVGCGIGLDRLVMWLAGCSHLRDAIAFPMVRNK